MRHLDPRLFLAGLLLAGGVAAQEPAQEPSWDMRAARHLINRAGFGAKPGPLERTVERGLEATVDRLLDAPEGESFFAEPITWAVDRATLREQGPDAMRRARADLRRRDKLQRAGYLEDWMRRMLAGEDPLRERMTLFWHGVFTTQSSKVKDSYALVRQSQLIREHALENYGDLLRAMLHDPAMLRYLDNGSNRREHPNENLAREVLELFSLGEGNYTEEDVREVARALTGYGYNKSEEFRFSAEHHDYGLKTILGVTQRHDADTVVDVILAQPACGRWVAGLLITYLEGVAPEPARLEDYGQFLRGRNYELRPFLRRLLTDPEFYRDEVVGARVQSPVDYLVGSCRRLGLRAEPEILVGAAGLLGEQLLNPPNVKGWEGGFSWITTSTLLARGNLMGGLLGVVGRDDLRVDPEELAEVRAELGDETDTLAMADEDELVMAPDDGMMMGEEDELAMAGAAPTPRDLTARLLRGLEKSGGPSGLHLTRWLVRSGATEDRAVVDALCERLLAIEAPLDTRRMLTRFLRDQRKALGLDLSDPRAAGPEVEHLLRRLVHLLLSLPEAQLG